MPLTCTISRNPARLYGPFKSFFNAACDSWMREPQNAGKSMSIHVIPSMVSYRRPSQPAILLLVSRQPEFGHLTDTFSHKKHSFLLAQQTDLYWMKTMISKDLMELIVVVKLQTMLNLRCKVARHLRVHQIGHNTLLHRY